MSKHSFRTKNQLFVHRYLFILFTLFILLGLFLIIADFGFTSRFVLKLEAPSISFAKFSEFTEASPQERIKENENISTLVVTGEKAPSVYLYDPEDDNGMIKAQLQITKQPYTALSDPSEAPLGAQFLIVDADSLTDGQAATIRARVKSGTAVLFTGIPADAGMSQETLSLMGIRDIEEETEWPGIRTSSDLLTGTMVQKEEYKVTGNPVTLGENVKIYASALPNRYWMYENDDLPPLIWRYVADETSGPVYVFNGNFLDSEMGYGILPVVLSEINDNYIYPIINAYCLTVSGYPYADNEERENWERLYSRDKMGIEYDMLTSQLKRYSQVYSTRITYFSPDFDTFAETDDNTLTYFTHNIDATRGYMARLDRGEMRLSTRDNGTVIKPWETDFDFWDEKTGSLQLPICFNVTTDNTYPEEYCIAGFGSTLGYFAVNIDYGEFLDYAGDEDIWILYCNDQEVMLGEHNRDYGWMERVTMDEAFSRLLKLLNMEIHTAYNEDSIDIRVENFEDEAYFILRSKYDEITIDNGTIEEVGTDYYFVTLTDSEAQIRWEED